MSEFKKGVDPRRNTKGRPKGQKNRTTEQVRGLIQQFIEDNIDDIQADYNALEGKDRLQFFEKLLKHILPQPLHVVDALTDEDFERLLARIKEDFKTN